MKPHYRRGLQNWEEKEGKSIQFNNSNTFLLTGWWKNALPFQKHMKPQTPKKFQLPKRIRFPRSISQRIRENVPSEIPPLKSHWKMAHLIGDSIPKHPTEDSTLEDWGNVQQDFPGVVSLHQRQSSCTTSFFCWAGTSKFDDFFSSKKSALTALQIDTSARQILHREHTQWASAAPLTPKKNILSCIFDFIQSVTLHTSRRSWKIPKKTSHHRKGPKASISHKVSASPLGNTTPTTLPNIVSGQVTMRRAPPGSIRWMWPQRGLFRGSGSKPIRTCVQQWEVVVF